MIYLRLFLEFFKIGLFSVGGGLATIPFLQDLGVRTGWFTAADLADMIAVSESTPGPMGVNMSTYVGFTCGMREGGLGPVGGILGAVVGVLGLVAPSVIVILLVSMFLKKFRSSKIVDGVFQGLRPASTALIAAAGVSVAGIALLSETLQWEDPRYFTIRFFTTHPFQDWSWGVSFYWPAIAIAVVVFVCMRAPKLKKLHPILYIALAAVVGIVFQL